MRLTPRSGALWLPLALAACSDGVVPTESPEARLLPGRGVQAIASGTYQYSQPLPPSLGGGAAIIDVTMTTNFDADGSASGSFRHFGMIQGLAVDFSGVVTCAEVDLGLGRVWIGGVITANNSEHPFVTGPINAVGKDIWFRAADRGNGDSGEADRSTFVGFEGGQDIDTSQEYCDLAIWPNDANPVVSGNLMVK